jgi:hypothetical protein
MVISQRHARGRRKELAVCLALTLLSGCAGGAGDDGTLETQDFALAHDGVKIEVPPTWCGSYPGSAAFQYADGAYDPFAGDALSATWSHSVAVAVPAATIAPNFAQDTCPTGSSATCAASDDLPILDITSGTLALTGGSAEINALAGPFRAVFDVDSAAAGASRELRWESQSVRASVSVVSVGAEGGQVVLFGRYNTEFDLYAAIFRFAPDGTVQARLKRKLCGYYMGLPSDAWIAIPSTRLPAWTSGARVELRFDIEQDASAHWWLKLYARGGATVPWGTPIVLQRVDHINALPAFAAYGGALADDVALAAGTAGLRLDTIRVSLSSLSLGAP